MKLSVKLLVVLAVLLVVAEMSEARRHRRRWRHRRCRRTHITPAPARTTQAPTTPTPATIPPDVMALFDALAALPLLLFFNMFANTLPPPTDEVPVPLARSSIHARSLDDSEDLCSGWELSQESSNLVNDAWYGRIGGERNSEQLRNFLNGLHICELMKMSERLDNIGRPARDMLNVFMLAPDTPAAIRKSVHVEFIMAAADAQHDSVHRSKRQSFNYNYNQQNAYLLLRRFNEAMQNPQLMQTLTQLYLQRFPATTTTPAPPTPSGDTKKVLRSVMTAVFPSMGIGLTLSHDITYGPNSFEAYVSSVADVVTTSHTFIRQLERILRRLIQATKFRRWQAACNRLYRFATSIRRPYGERLLAAYAYKWFNCARPDNATPDLRIKPTTTTTTTTPAPTSACGVSRELDSLREVDSEQFFATTRLTGGTNTGSCSLVPWQVRLNVTEGQHSRFCAGSILDATHILTAAHCFKNESTVEVIVGDYRLNNTESSEQTRVVKASDVAIHPEYYTDAYGQEVHDVAVVKLSEPLDMSQPCTEPVCLQPDFTLTDGQNCTVSGWSSLAGAHSMTGKLQFANLATYQGDQCKSAFNIPFSFYVIDPSNQLCAGFEQDGVDPCQGDAGGPLVCRDSATDAYVQVGIVSYGNGCGMQNFPGVYAKVGSYYDWIKAQLNI